VPRENAAAKARRYLAEGRVVVTDASAAKVRATVRGDGALDPVEYLAGAWSCPCAARGRCAHLLAVGLVTAPGRAA
jgi:uncharacterized Zn finger protein